MRKANQALKPQGYLCFSTFSTQNLTEIKQLTGQGLHYLSMDALQQQLKQQGFEVLHCSEQLESLSFEHPKQILQHLKATGVTGTAQGQRWNKTTLTEFYRGYEQFSQQHSSQQIIRSRIILFMSCTENAMTAQVYFVSGIDTGIGKTYALTVIWPKL